MSIRVASAPASGGTATTASVVASATTGMPIAIASMQAQPERGPPAQVQVRPPPAQLRVHPALRQVVVAGQPVGGQPQVVGQPGHTHAEDVERRDLGELGQQVGPGDPPSAYRLVDHHGEPVQLAGVGRGGVRRCRARPRWCGWPPVSQKSWLNRVTWAMSRSSRSAIGCRVFGTSPCLGCCARRRSPAGRGRGGDAATRSARSISSGRCRMTRSTSAAGSSSGLTSTALSGHG